MLGKILMKIRNEMRDSQVQAGGVAINDNKANKPRLIIHQRPVAPDQQNSQNSSEPSGDSQVKVLKYSHPESNNTRMQEQPSTNIKEMKFINLEKSSEPQNKEIPAVINTETRFENIEVPKEPEQVKEQEQPRNEVRFENIEQLKEPNQAENPEEVKVININIQS
jgi:hypothetical protein